MRKFKRFPPRTLRFRLLLVVAGALLLGGAFVPKTHAAPIVYWNFDDTPGNNQPMNMISDAPGPTNVTLVPFGVNPYTFPDMRGSVPGINLGSITGPSVVGMGLSGSARHSPAEFRFALPNPGNVFSNMTFSFAINREGNGFVLASLAYSTTGINGTFTVFQTTGVPSGGTVLVTAPVPTAANNQPNLAFSIILFGGQSNGNNVQNVVDNILIDGTIVPEPATIAGGLLGVLALCWHQRRRLIRSVRFRRT